MPPLDNAGSGDASAAGLVMSPGAGDGMFAPRAVFDVECVGADGAVKWTDRAHNLVTTPGKTDILDKYLKGSAYTASWFVILKGTGSADAADTLASHAGWTEQNGVVSSATRPGITWGTTATGSNTSSAVAISITGSGTVAGAGIASVATGTSGVLYNVGDFSASRTVASGDTLNITIQLTIS